MRVALREGRGPLLLAKVGKRWERAHIPPARTPSGFIVLDMMVAKSRANVYSDFIKLINRRGCDKYGKN